MVFGAERILFYGEQSHQEDCRWAGAVGDKDNRAFQGQQKALERHEDDDSLADRGEKESINRIQQLIQSIQSTAHDHVCV